jgi:hypothetical protein
MNETSLVGKWVRYYGSDYRYYGEQFEIIDQGMGGNAKRIRVNFPDGPQWKTLGESFSKPFDMANETKVSPASDVLFNPHAEAIRVIDNELTRLQERIEQLKTAKKVLQSL